MKALVFVPEAEVALRFVASGAFDALEAAHDVVYVGLEPTPALPNASVLPAFAGSRRRLRLVPYHIGRFLRWREMFDLSCIRHRERSDSFRVRIEGSRRNDPLRYAFLEGLVRTGADRVYQDLIERRLGLHPELLGVAREERPDFIVLPSSLLDCMTDDVLQMSAVLRVPTLMLVAGWDNLSSKGLIHHAPARVGVWGEQTVAHAVDVQDLPRERVFAIGAPHFDQLRAARTLDRGELRRGLDLPLDRPVVLFAGTLRLFDETTLLRDLEARLASGALPPLHVLYRPHPLRERRPDEASFLDFTWRHVTLDPEARDAYADNKAGRSASVTDAFFRRTEHLARLYAAVDAVVSPMSTVLLEAVVSGLPPMAVAFGDGKHWWSADKVSRMMHFRELYDLPELIVCRDRERFFDDLVTLLSRAGDEDLRQRLRQASRFFVHEDARPYGERVTALVDDMMAGAAPFTVHPALAARPGRSFALESRVRARLRDSAPLRSLRRAAGDLRRRLVA